MNLLQINSLNAGVSGLQTPILKNLNLQVKAGEVHAIMGPNGSGKSTLSKILAGHPEYAVFSGQVLYEINRKMKDLTALTPDERAREGVFLAFQYPTEIPGVSNFEFLRASFNAICKHQGAEELDAMDFRTFIDKKLKNLDWDANFINREVNVDFSGGEKKRNEILQMAVLSPRLAILDETDSGLDVDSLRVVSEAVNKIRSQQNAIILITHYHRILSYIVPDFVHVLHNGNIIHSGDKNLALEIESRGYDWLLEAKH